VAEVEGIIGLARARRGTSGSQSLIRLVPDLRIAAAGSSGSGSGLAR